MRLIQTVDLGVIRRNIAAVRARTGVRVLVMVKADAYGHGMTEVARAIADEADMLGVATLEEGEELRKCAVKTPVLVAICPPGGLMRASAAGLTAAVADAEKGVYSHFGEPSAAQAERFGAAASLLVREFPAVTTHLASSSSLDMPEARRDMVRIGHAAYLGAMRVESRVIAVRRVRAGESVGYGHHPLPRDAVIAVVFGGYFDGVYRESPSPVLIGGRECPAAGSVCMDMFAVDVGDMPVREGDPVILLGGALTARKVAAARGTTQHEVMTSWHGRTERVYVDQTGSTQESECRGGENERRGERVGVGSDHGRSHLT